MNYNEIKINCTFACDSSEFGVYKSVVEWATVSRKACLPVLKPLEMQVQEVMEILGPSSPFSCRINLIH